MLDREFPKTTDMQIEGFGPTIIEDPVEREKSTERAPLTTEKRSPTDDQLLAHLRRINERIDDVTADVQNPWDMSAAESPSGTIHDRIRILETAARLLEKQRAIAHDLTMRGLDVGGYDHGDHTADDSSPASEDRAGQPRDDAATEPPDRLQASIENLDRRIEEARKSSDPLSLDGIRRQIRDLQQLQLLLRQKTIAEQRLRIFEHGGTTRRSPGRYSTKRTREFVEV
jgi:hypothetical protein